MENTTLENTTVAKTTSEASKAVKPVYTAEQLVAGYKALGASRAIVECALKLTGKDKFTIDEATKIINTFKNKR